MCIYLMINKNKSLLFYLGRDDNKGERLANILDVQIGDEG